ncbi:type I-F CRISPR-associated protein Csy1 [Flocculibacter collagenilyticus]|uniref:type I-F CRISPR-associated protein Csy1 n=1 Tax=Flocculibacter collagenilyticus TaxID=2744479 RepID=UPI0018F5C9CC|nr:type I-F CRISPR-associated protein Csy1 [Flocculibacter collagenilyticus]
METGKTELRRNLDKLIKLRLEMPPKKEVKNGKSETDYFKALTHFLKKYPTGYLPNDKKECDSSLLMVSTNFTSVVSTYKYENTFKFYCEIEHPVLDEIAKDLSLSSTEMSEIMSLAKSFEVEKLEAYYLFKDNTKHDNLNTFSSEGLVEVIDKIAADSKHGTIVTHPAKMSQPSCKYPRISVDDFESANDGFIRSGNAASYFDLHINANKLKVFKFLSLSVNRLQVIEHIKRGNVKVISEAFKVEIEKAEQWVEDFQHCITSQVNKSHPLIKQVYFPVATGYHQLSLLTPAGLVFNLKNKIEWINKRSPKAYLGRQAQINNVKVPYSYSSVMNLTVTKHGGDHPKNISGLNNKFQSYYLLLSSPPSFKHSEIRVPKKSVFGETISPWYCREIFYAIHKIFQTPYERSPIPNKNMRKGVSNHIQKYIDFIINRVWSIRLLLSESDISISASLPKYQQVWLAPEHQEEREKTDEWLDKVVNEIAISFIKGYQKVLGKQAEKLGDSELAHIKKVVGENKEALR